MPPHPRTPKHLLPALAAAIALAASTARAALTPTGDVSPADPSTWTTSTTAYIGNTSAGTVTVNGGSALYSAEGWLGYARGASGAVTVDGVGSTWALGAYYLYVGLIGTATLNITNGASVSNTWSSFIAGGSGSTGTVTVDGTGSTWMPGAIRAGEYGDATLNILNGAKVTVASQTALARYDAGSAVINFGANGGTLTTQSLWAAPSQITGTGTIITRGLFSDFDLLFDATHGLSRTLTLTNAGQNVSLRLDMTANGTTGDLGVGYQGAASLTIRDGVQITSDHGCLANYPGATGTATVDGAGSSWTNRSDLTVGNGGTATLNITNGAKVSNTLAYIGEATGGTGTVTVDGAGSTWTNSSDLYVGFSGAATLNVTNGGKVTVAGSTIVAYGNTVNFGTNGGTLTTQSLYAAPAQLTGTGTINTRGLFNDGNLVFDATHGLNQTLTWIGANRNLTIHLDLSGASGAAGPLGVGNQGVGSLVIKQGVKVTSADGYLAYMSGSTGTATVDGPGSTWTCGTTYVGYSGAGTLNITNGGKVSATNGYLGDIAGATGAATVDGTGSTWTNSSTTYVGIDGVGSLTITNGGKVTTGMFDYLGYDTGSTGAATVDGAGSTWAIISSSLGVGRSGTGTVNITNGGKVTATGVWIHNMSLLAINVGDASKLDAGTGPLSNNGTIRLKAAPNLAPGAYTPITAASWSGSGTTQALGGTWSITSHSFIVTPVVTATAGQNVSFDLLQTQRVVITDPITSNTVEANFQSTTVTTNLTLSALTLTPTLSTLLQSALPANTNILTGWTLTPTGYTAGTPAFLSLQIGPNQSLATLALWHYDNNTWSPYAAPDLSYDGTYANFTVTSFSAYAVTQVPEPAPLTLLALALPPLLLPRRRRRNAGVPPAASAASSNQSFADTHLHLHSSLANSPFSLS